MQGFMAISKRDRTIWQSQKLLLNFPVNSVADESPMTDETTTDTFRYFSHFQCLGNILRERKLTPYSKTAHFSLKKTVYLHIFGEKVGSVSNRGCLDVLVILPEWNEENRGCITHPRLEIEPV